MTPDWSTLSSATIKALDAIKPHVRGHRCDGLNKHFAEAGRSKAFEQHCCTPSLDPMGRIEGCDGTNMVPIVFCPWCGVQIPEDEA